MRGDDQQSHQQTHWISVDLGCGSVRWCSLESAFDEPMTQETQETQETSQTPKYLKEEFKLTEHLKEQMLVKEIEMIVHAGARFTYGEEARRESKTTPQWLFRHLISLMEEEHHSPSPPIIESEQIFKMRSVPKGVEKIEHLVMPYCLKKSDGKTWLKTASGERRPGALLSDFISHILNPPQFIGEDSADSSLNDLLTKSLTSSSIITPSVGMICLTSPARSPLVQNDIVRCISDLSIDRRGQINTAAAILIGEEKVGLWGVLDIGLSQASWSLIHAERELIEVITHYGQVGVGVRQLEHIFLLSHLEKEGVRWAHLTDQERTQWFNQVEREAYWTCRELWPTSIKIALQIHGQLSPNINNHHILNHSEMFKEYHHLIYQKVLEWVSHSLQYAQVGLEGLAGIMVTGSFALSLFDRLRRALPAVKVYPASPNASLKGADLYGQSVDRATQSILIKDVSPQRLTLHRPNQEMIEVFPEQTPLATYRAIWIDGAHQGVTLWFSTYGSCPTLAASHPPFNDSRRLHVYYDGPSTLTLEWDLESSDSLQQSNQWEIKC